MSRARPDRGRDRDPDGRPRQSRPRDELGRPLPYDQAGVEPVPEAALPPLETVGLARELVAAGRHFAAHEVLEARWKSGPPAESDLWQGLAQLCVGLTHQARGNPIGAGRLLARGSARLRSYVDGGGPSYGVDIATILRCVDGKCEPAASVANLGAHPAGCRGPGPCVLAHLGGGQGEAGVRLVGRGGEHHTEDGAAAGN